MYRKQDLGIIANDSSDRRGGRRVEEGRLMATSKAESAGEREGYGWPHSSKDPAASIHRLL